MSRKGNYEPEGFKKFSKWKNEIDKLNNRGKISDEKRKQLRKKRKKRK